MSYAVALTVTSVRLHSPTTAADSRLSSTAKEFVPQGRADWFPHYMFIALHSLQKRSSLVNVRLTKCAELVTALGLSCGVPVAPHQGNKRGQSSSGSSYPITKRQPQEHVTPTATKLRLVSAVWLALASDSNLELRRSYVRGNPRQRITDSPFSLPA